MCCLNLFRAPIPGGGFNLTKTYPSSLEFPYASTCNDNCHCSLGFQLPVCGTDDVTYLTPCHAGCTGAKFEIPVRSYLLYKLSLREISHLR